MSTTWWYIDMMVHDNISETIWYWSYNIVTIMQIFNNDIWNMIIITFAFLESWWIQWVVPKPTGQNWKRCYTTRKFLAYFFCLIRIIVLRRETFSKRKFCNFRKFRTSSVEFDPRKKFFVKICESLSHVKWTSNDNLMKTETYFQVYHWNWQTFLSVKIFLLKACDMFQKKAVLLNSVL